MPSTHSGVITYYAVYTTLAATYLPLHPSLSPTMRIIGPLVVTPVSAVIAISRIWLEHHTLAQVIVGSAHGIAFAPLWLYVWTHYASNYGWDLERTYLNA